MLKRKCPSCSKKIDKKFNYCPYCGVGFRQKRDEDNFGMLGRDDIFESQERRGNEIKMPFGLNTIMNSLVKQLEKQFSDIEGNSGNLPKGFKIQISTGKPQMQRVEPVREKVSEKVEMVVVSEEESERRKSLPKVDAESKVRRLSDRIIYEIAVPGVKDRKDVRISRLEGGVEIRAYSRDKCYVKVIPLKVEVISYSIQKDVLVVELKG